MIFRFDIKTRLKSILVSKEISRTIWYLEGSYYLKGIIMSQQKLAPWKHVTTGRDIRTWNAIWYLKSTQGYFDV